MKILFVGDIFGRSGRDALQKHLPELRRELELDIVVVNGDNPAHGRGITEKICEEFYACGTDVITSGDHVWDQREIISYIARDKNLIRPMNYKQGTPGAGCWEKQLSDGRTMKVLHLQGRVFMNPIEDPFAAADRYLEKHKIGNGTSVLVDFHAEATSEKMAMGHYLDGRASAVLGTHTHVPTADTMILPGGTGYQTDAGMSGDYDSVIGAQKGDAIDRMVKQMPRMLVPAEGEATLSCVYIETDDSTGKTLGIRPIRRGGKLAAA